MTAPLKSRPFRILLLSQAIATLAFAVVGGLWAGGHGAVSGALGGGEQARLRAKAARTRDALEAELGPALATITAHDAQGWFRFCGYPASN